MSLKTYHIFLASSVELAHERNLATAAIADFVSLHPEHKVSFQVIKWENFAATFEDARKQDQYNASIPTCEIFLMLFWTKVGKYTHEEYTIAQKALAENQKPLLLLMEKIDGTNKEPSVGEFKKQVPHGNGLFSATFKNDENLKSIIKEELQKLFKDGLLKKGQPATLLSTKAADEPQGFLGREEELKIIREKLRNQGGKLMLINAEGGIGKTTLAAKYWNDSLHEYKHNAWLFCDGGIINALKDLAPKLNLDLAGMDEQQQLGALRLALSEKQDGFLLVLDNANNEEDIKVFKQEFEGFHWHVLITSRCQGVLDKELPITHLPPPLAKELFERYYKEDTTDFEHLLDRVLKSIQYHTLLTEVFAKNLAEAAEMGHLNLKTFLDKLENEGLHLGKASFEIENNAWAEKRKAATTDDILDALYDFGKLSHEQNYLLVNLAMLPSEPYTLAFINSLLANETNRNERQIQDTLKALVKKGWISENDKKYRLSQVIQDLALHKNKETLGTDAQELLNKLNYILATDAYNLLNTSLSAARPFIKLLPQLNKSLANKSSMVIGNLNFNAGIYFNNVGDMVNARYCAEQYGIIYQNLFVKEPDNLDYKNGLAISYSKLGGIYETIGDWKNALLNYQEYNRLQTENNKSSPENLEYKNGLAISYSKLGGIYEATGDWKNALLSFKEYSRIAKENVFVSPQKLQYKNILAISYDKLGGIYVETGDWKNALLNYREYNRLEKEITDSSPQNLEYKNGLAISFSRLGGIYQHTGDWENALLNYQKFNRLEKEISESSPENLKYKNGLAISYLNLGVIYQSSGDQENALFNYQEYNRLEIEITESSPENLGYKNNLAISYSKLGEIYEAKGDLKNALLNYQERNKIGREIYKSSPENISYKNGLAISHGKLAGVFVANEQISEAVLNYDLSRKIFLEIVLATDEKLVEFVYNFAWTCIVQSELVKQHSLFELFDKEQLINIRQEGFKYIQPIFKAGLLQSNMVGVAEALSDEGWYEF